MFRVSFLVVIAALSACETVPPPPMTPLQAEAHKLLKKWGADVGAGWDRTTRGELSEFREDWGLPQSEVLTEVDLAYLRREHDATKPRIWPVQGASDGCSVWNPLPQAKETITWQGKCVDDRPHGDGVMTWRFTSFGSSIEDTYTGPMVAGKRHGPAHQVWGRGSEYRGTFVEDKFHGKGYRRYRSGATYDGDFRNGRRHGRGFMKLVSGDTYEGEFVEGARTGSTVYRAKSGDVYRGQMLDGKRHGQGVMEYDSGSRYEGSFKDGVRHGQGKIVFYNGGVYEGQWARNVPNGLGTALYVDGFTTTGEWKDGCLELESGRLAWIVVDRDKCRI